MFNKKTRYHRIGDLISPQKKSHKTRNALIVGGSVVAAILVGAAAKNQDKP